VLAACVRLECVRLECVRLECVRLECVRLENRRSGLPPATTQYGATYTEQHEDTYIQQYEDTYIQQYEDTYILHRVPAACTPRESKQRPGASRHVGAQLLILSLGAISMCTNSTFPSSRGRSKISCKCVVKMPRQPSRSRSSSTAPAIALPARSVCGLKLLVYEALSY
jgi:hypothetical protein